MISKDKESQPVISVIVDNYNYGRYLGQAIESVLSQTYPSEKTEIIVVDDGSTDDSREIIAKYGGAVIPVYKENGGQASALSAGFSEAKGDIVSLLDSDDYWHQEKLQEVARAFNSPESPDFVYHYMDVVDNDCRLVDRYVFPDFGREGFLEKYLSGELPFFSPTSGMSIRRDCLRHMMPLPDEFKIAADIHLHYVIPFYARGLSLIRRPLGSCRLHGENLSGGNLLTVAKLQRERDFIFRNMTHVEHHAKVRGRDCSLLIRRMEAAAKIYDVYILAAGGQRGAALKEAVRFDDFLPGDSPLGKAARKMTLMIAASVSPSLNLQMQRIYRKVLFFLGRHD